MTNYPNGVTTPDLTATNATVTTLTATTATVTNQTVTNQTATATNTATLKVGASGDTVNSVITYTSTNTNIAAINTVSYLEVSATVTGAANADMIIGAKKTTLVAGLHIVGAQVSAANTVAILLYNSTANTINASVDTFSLTLKR